MKVSQVQPTIKQNEVKSIQTVTADFKSSTDFDSNFKSNYFIDKGDTLEVLSYEQGEKDEESDFFSMYENGFVIFTSSVHSASTDEQVVFYMGIDSFKWFTKDDK